MADSLPAALAAWNDPVLVALAKEFPLEPHASTDVDPFVSLCRSIIHQQVSMAAATTIFKRLQETTGPLTPHAVLQTAPDAMRAAGLSAAGLSAAKVRYVTHLAQTVAAGLDLRFTGQEDADVVAQLTKINGIGPWSAKMFLMFHLGRLDVCPWEDLGIRLAVAKFYGVPAPKASTWLKQKHVEWAPYNSVAARVLWRARRLA